MRSNLLRWSFALAALAFCGMAEAHPEHATSYMAGLAHPFLGPDHLLAMLAVGVWAAQSGGRAMWLVPASFVTVMALAGSIGAAGITCRLVPGIVADNGEQHR